MRKNKNGMWIIDGVQLHSHLGYYFVRYKGKLASGVALFKSINPLIVIVKMVEEIIATFHFHPRRYFQNL